MRSCFLQVFTVVLQTVHLTASARQTTDSESFFVHQDIVCSLPPPSQWMYRPIFLQADESNTRILNNNKNKNSRRRNNTGKELFLGQPIAFESDLFQGQIVIRLANTTTSTTTTYNGKDDDSRQQHRRKTSCWSSSLPSSSSLWLWQYTVQGRFRESIPMDQLYMGEIYDQPLVGIPPSWIMNAVRKIFSILVPGIKFQVDHPTNPKVLALLGGTINTLRVDEPGHQPDIMKGINNNVYDNNDDDDENGFVIESSTTISPQFTSAAARRSILRRPQQAATYVFDTHHVYTFQHMDSVMDYTQYKVNLPPGILQVDLVPHLNGQAMSLGAISTNNDERWLFRFRIWNERAVMAEQNRCQLFCDEKKSKNTH
jgi:hypothetical protein